MRVQKVSSGYLRILTKNTVPSENGALAERVTNIQRKKCIQFKIPNLNYTKSHLTLY